MRRHSSGAQASPVSAQQVRSLVKVGIAWSALESFGVRGASFVFFLFLARLLSPEVFGLMAAAAVVWAAADYLTEQGLGSAVVQRQHLDPAHLDTAFWMQLGASFVLAIAGVLIAPWLAATYQRPELTTPIRVLMLGTPLSALSSMQQALLKRNLAFKLLARRSLAASVIGGVTAVALAMAGAGVWSL